MRGLAAALGVPVDGVDAAGWDADALEAQAFAFLAVRSALGLLLSFPGTTGVPRPMTGGHFNLPRRSSAARSLADPSSASLHGYQRSPGSALRA